MATAKRILIIAGPNGAGKTTFAMEFLPKEAKCPTFVNADLIAAGLNPLHPEAAAIRAGRTMLDLIRSYTRMGQSFAFETTLSGLGFARRIRRRQDQGYTVKLAYLSLPSSEMAIARVRQRVSEGGHDVPEHVVRRRYRAGWKNFETAYRELVDKWIVYDNSLRSPSLVAEGGRR